MSTLASSSALFRLHRSRGPYRMAIDFKAARLRQVRRAIRRHRVICWVLEVRALFLDLGACFSPATAVKRASWVIYLTDESGRVRATADGYVPTRTVIKRRPPEIYSILRIASIDWIVVEARPFLWWHIVQLKQKLN